MKRIVSQSLVVVEAVGVRFREELGGFGASITATTTTATRSVCATILLTILNTAILNNGPVLLSLERALERALERERKPFVFNSSSHFTNILVSSLGGKT